MAGKTICRFCSTPLKKRGTGKNIVSHGVNLCIDCLDRIFPERGDLPVMADSDDNVYFLHEAERRVYIFFSYGEVPYTSCTEVDIGEECLEMGCGDHFFVAP
jgi:hypothetical protein